jgi:hypothetical protein
MARPRNLLAGRRYDLGATKSNKVAPLWVHAGVAGGGILLGYVTYPYANTPVGMTLMGAAGSIAAVGILLIVYDLVRNESIVETVS